MIIRLSKALLVLQLAAFSLLVAFTNTVDYGTNFEFVVHVMSMDAIPPESAIKWRSVQAPWAHQLSYNLIIAAEYSIGLICLFGAIRLFSNRREPAMIFNSTKIWAISGLVAGFFLWFFGFLLVAGEWFAMWQSPDFNGQQSAFRMAAIFLLVLVFICLPDQELDT